MRVSASNYEIYGVNYEIYGVNYEGVDCLVFKF